MSAKRPLAKGRIASRSNAPAQARPILLLATETEKWFDQNATSRSTKPIGAAQARARRAAASTRNICCSSGGGGFTGPIIVDITARAPGGASIKAATLGAGMLCLARFSQSARSRSCFLRS